MPDNEQFTPEQIQQLGYEFMADVLGFDPSELGKQESKALGDTFKQNVDDIIHDAMESAIAYGGDPHGIAHHHINAARDFGHLRADEVDLAREYVDGHFQNLGEQGQHSIKAQGDDVKEEVDLAIQRGPGYSNRLGGPARGWAHEVIGNRVVRGEIPLDDAQTAHNLVDGHYDDRESLNQSKSIDEPIRPKPEAYRVRGDDPAYLYNQDWELVTDHLFDDAELATQYINNPENLLYHRTREHQLGQNLSKSYEVRIEPKNGYGQYEVNTHLEGSDVPIMSGQNGEYQDAVDAAIQHAENLRSQGHQVRVLDNNPPTPDPRNNPNHPASVQQDKAYQTNNESPYQVEELDYMPGSYRVVDAVTGQTLPYFPVHSSREEASRDIESLREGEAMLQHEARYGQNSLDIPKRKEMAIPQVKASPFLNRKSLTPNYQVKHTIKIHHETHNLWDPNTREMRDESRYPVTVVAPLPSGRDRVWNSGSFLTYQEARNRAELISRGDVGHYRKPNATRMYQIEDNVPDEHKFLNDDDAVDLGRLDWDDEDSGVYLGEGPPPPRVRKKKPEGDSGVYLGPGNWDDNPFEYLMPDIPDEHKSYRVKGNYDLSQYSMTPEQEDEESETENTSHSSGTAQNTARSPSEAQNEISPDQTDTTRSAQSSTVDSPLN